MREQIVRRDQFMRVCEAMRAQIVERREDGGATTQPQERKNTQLSGTLLRSVFVCPTYAGRRFQRAVLGRRSYKLDVMGGHDGPVPPNCTLPCPQHSYSQPTDRSRAKAAIGRPRIGSTKKNTLEALGTLKPFLSLFRLPYLLIFIAIQVAQVYSTFNTQEVSRIFQNLCHPMAPIFPCFGKCRDIFTLFVHPEHPYKSIPTRSHSRHLYTHTANSKVHFNEVGSCLYIEVFSCPLGFTPLQIVLPFQMCNTQRRGYVLLLQMVLLGKSINTEHSRSVQNLCCPKYLCTFSCCLFVWSEPIRASPHVPILDISTLTLPT